MKAGKPLHLVPPSAIGDGASPAARSTARGVAAPRLLLIGVGRFGSQHLLEWQQLAREGRVDLIGLVVAGAEHAAALAAQTGLPVHAGLSTALLDGVDAVDIASPAATHEALVAQCLPHCHVLVEKPLCSRVATAESLQALADRHGKVLMVGHLYHHHPLSAWLQQQAAGFAGTLHTLAITMTNPWESRVAALDPLAEWVHGFDLLQLCAPGPVEACSAWCEADGAVVHVSVAMASGARAVLRLGWTGHERVRRVELASADVHVTARFDDQLLTIQHRDRIDKRWLDGPAAPLRAQLCGFLDVLAGRAAVVPTAAQVLGSLTLVERARSALRPPTRPVARARPDRPRVAVLGGGVFGASCAVELGASCEVTLIERHPALLQEASWINQWRHHSGFHYPRSIETIREVLQSKADFESVYEGVIVRDLEASYAVSAFADEITPERYLATCRANDLRFQEVSPPADIVYPDRVSVCIRTDEAVVEIGRLSRQLVASLQGLQHVDVRLGCEAVGGRLLPDGRKALMLAQGSEAPLEHAFDFVVNATYVNRNRVSRWFGFAQRPLRFDLMEMSVVQIPGARRFMMTIIDGPFTSLTSVGEGDLFMLSHIHQSVLASQVSADGLPPDWPRTSANRQGLLRHGLRYLPLLQQARHVESRVGIRTVEAYTDDFDGRPTVVTPHGFGCWSVLGGKIVTVVSNARYLATEIARQSQHLRG